MTLVPALTALPRAAQVGKTSLILSLVGEEFPEEVRGAPAVGVGAGPAGGPW